MQVAAILGQLPGAGQANALGSTGNEGDLAVQLQIHVSLPVLLTAFIVRAKAAEGSPVSIRPLFRFRSDGPPGGVGPTTMTMLPPTRSHAGEESVDGTEAGRLSYL